MHLVTLVKVECLFQKVITTKTLRTYFKSLCWRSHPTSSCWRHAGNVNDNKIESSDVWWLPVAWYSCKVWWTAV